MSYEKLFNLKTNPFRITPDAGSENILWAGFPELREKFENRIKKSIQIPNSSLILNWGDYGSGKTHAAKYFSQTNVLEEIANDKSIPFTININFPKGKQTILDIYTSIIDIINIDDIREKFANVRDKIINFIEKTNENLLIQNILKAIFVELHNSKTTNGNLIKKYLYNTISTAEMNEIKEYNILRKLNSDNDYIQFIASFFGCLTFEKKIYSCVIFWIDEFESIISLNMSNQADINNFIRGLIDYCPNNLLVFMNLTQSSIIRVSDLSAFLSEAVKSRIKDRINFESPTTSQLFEFLEELLKSERLDIEINEANKYFPFEKNVIEQLIVDLGKINLRDFNEALSLLLELAEFENIKTIDNNFYANNKEEVIGIKL